MHGAFDVGLQNKRLVMFADKPVFMDKPKDALPQDNPKEDAEKREPRTWTVTRWIALFFAYLALILSDYFVLPSLHGTKVALVVLTSTPLVLTYMHVQRDATEYMVAVTGAHFVVCVLFLADQQRLHRALIDPVTMVLVVAGVCAYSWKKRRPDPADATCFVHSGVVYLVALAVLVVVQTVDLLPGHVVLLLQQTFVCLSIVLLFMAQQQL